MMRFPALALFALCCMSPVSARKAQPPQGTLILDMASPVVTVTIADVPLRLRVAPDQKHIIELNRAAADRLPLRFESGADAFVGREKLTSITAAAQVVIDRRRFMAQIESHERDCCDDVDGEIGITLLPYATIRMLRAGAAADLPPRRYLIEDSDERGPETRLRIGNADLFAAFSLTRPLSVTTFSAGVLLARAQGGELRPGPGPDIAAAFGVVRPTRTLRLARPASVAGFTFSELPVRIADFGGRLDFPAEATRLDDIVVKARVEPQQAWPVVLIGRDRLDHCAELRYDAAPKELTLRCDFAR